MKNSTMMRPQNECISPYLVLSKYGDENKGKTFNFALKQMILQTKTNKFSLSLQQPAEKIKPKFSKDSDSDFPLFLKDYLYDTNYRSSPETQSSISVPSQKPLKKSEGSNSTPQDLQNKNDFFSEDSKIQTEKSSSFTPTHQNYEIPDSRKPIPRTLYKPYTVKISPRATMRLYSPSPIRSDFSDVSKKNTKRGKLPKISDKNSKKETDSKPIPVLIDQYTKAYADKLKKVLEISEQARIEAGIFPVLNRVK